ncbi:MAG TPA: hypothetical protein VKK79_08185 [Candidatus Lokiarchaeia archaeon]|nr:hypothetical protein [Candidatus Lokiarchaeia archaeon]
MEICRVDPRLDKEAMIHLTREFCEWSKVPFDAKTFETELNTRLLDLKKRNAIVLAKEDEELVGIGFFTIFKTHLGQDECIFHKVITSKANSFKKGIEEAIIREMMKYAKNTLKIAKFQLNCPDADSGYRNLLMKLGITKSANLLYEKVIEEKVVEE